MTIQDAIKLAIKGGFVHGGVNDKRSDDERIRAFVLLPQFWQCLGKAMGWGKGIIVHLGKPKKDNKYQEEPNGEKIKDCEHEFGYKAIGGFSGHAHTHPTGKQICFNCGKTIDEILKTAFENQKAEIEKECLKRCKEAKIETAKATKWAVKEEILKEINILIAQEIIIATKEGQKTSRLTSLAVKLNQREV